MQQEKTPPQEHQEQQSQNTERQTKHKNGGKLAQRLSASDSKASSFRRRRRRILIWWEYAFFLLLLLQRDTERLCKRFQSELLLSSSWRRRRKILIWWHYSFFLSSCSSAGRQKEESANLVLFGSSTGVSCRGWIDWLSKDLQKRRRRERERERERERRVQARFITERNNRQTWQMSQRGGESGSGRNGTRWCLLTSLFAEWILESQSAHKAASSAQQITEATLFAQESHCILMVCFVYRENTHTHTHTHTHSLSLSLSQILQLFSPASSSLPFSPQATTRKFSCTWNTESENPKKQTNNQTTTQEQEQKPARSNTASCQQQINCLSYLNQILQSSNWPEKREQNCRCENAGNKDWSWLRLFKKKEEEDGEEEAKEEEMEMESWKLGTRRVKKPGM